MLDCEDAFYGGAARGGKSIALLMAALQYVDIPGYNALLIRDTYANLSKPGSLIPLSYEWLANTDAKWHGAGSNIFGKSWEFPSGATLSFGHMDGPMAHHNYQSADYQFVGIDEVVNIPEHQALYLFSRQSRTVEQERIGLPVRFRCASNPPSREQVARGAWVKARYVDPETRGDRIFIPAWLDDNSYIDNIQYRKSLSQLDPVTRKQLEEGDWEIQASGDFFKREWFKDVIDTVPVENVKVIRYWDMAATEPKPGQSQSNQPAYTAGCKMWMTPGGIFYFTMLRGQWSPRSAEINVRQTADIDGKSVHIWMEQEPGASGVATIDHYRRNILRGFTFRGNKVSKSKTQRAAPLASQAEAGNVHMIKGPWNADFLDEADLYPNGPFLDQIDAAAGAFEKLVGIGAGVIPRVGVVGEIQGRQEHTWKPELKEGEELIEIWEGDKVVAYEVIRPGKAGHDEMPHWLQGQVY